MTSEEIFIVNTCQKKEVTYKEGKANIRSFSEQVACCTSVWKSGRQSPKKGVISRYGCVQFCLLLSASGDYYYSIQFNTVGIRLELSSVKGINLQRLYLSRSQDLFIVTLELIFTGSFDCCEAKSTQNQFALSNAHF